jgi:uncharacterized protein
MSESKGARLAQALDEFITSSPDVEAAAVVSYDGLAMASALPEDMDEDRLGAMSAALLSLGEQAAQGLGRGELHQVFVEADHGFVFLMSARDEAVLSAITGRQAKIGLMLYEMRRAADTVGAVLERPAAPAQPAPVAAAPAPRAPAPAAAAADVAPTDGRHRPADETNWFDPPAEQHAAAPAQTAQGDGAQPMAAAAPEPVHDLPYAVTFPHDETPNGAAAHDAAPW